MRKLGLGIIGTGRVGKALAIHLSKNGWRIAGLYDNDLDKASAAARLVPTGYFDSIGQLGSRADILFLAVPDSQIANVAEKLGEIDYLRARFLLHASGILPANILHLAGLDRAVYSLHPFGSIPDNSTQKNPFSGLYFSGEGDEAAKPIARRISDSLDGKFIDIDSREKVSYHLAASFVANHLYALLSVGESLLGKSGLPPEKIRPMVLKIAKSALENYDKFGLRDGLTGPVARGDELTVTEHLIAAEKSGRKQLYEAGVAELRRIIENGRED